MRRLILSTMAACVLAGLAGCAAFEHGGSDLPSAVDYADADWFDPWRDPDRTWRTQRR